MRLLRVRRWVRLIVGVLLLTATAAWSHVPVDDVLCNPDYVGYSAATGGSGAHLTAGAKEEKSGHCAICHLRSLRSPGAFSGGSITEIVVTPAVDRSARAVHPATLANHFPARAPPAV